MNTSYPESLKCGITLAGNILLLSVFVLINKGYLFLGQTFILLKKSIKFMSIKVGFIGFRE